MNLKRGKEWNCVHYTLKTYLCPVTVRLLKFFLNCLYEQLRRQEHSSLLGLFLEVADVVNRELARVKIASRIDPRRSYAWRIQ